MSFDQKGFNEFIIDAGVLKFFEKPVVLKSGKTSHFYLNWRLNDVFSLNEISNYILEFAKEKGIEANCFYGVSEGATRLANMTQTKHAKQSPKYGLGSHVLPIGRTIPKEHGDSKDRYFVGEPEGKVVVLENITTTADSLIEKGIKPLQKMGLEITATIVLTDRSIPIGFAKEKVKLRTGVDYYAMSHTYGLLEKALKTDLTPKIRSAVEKSLMSYNI